MLETIIALFSKYAIPIIMSYIVMEVRLFFRTMWAKFQAKKEDQKAVDDASKQNDTSHLFGG